MKIKYRKNLWLEEKFFKASTVLALTLNFRSHVIRVSSLVFHTALNFHCQSFVSNLSLYSCRNTFFKASWQKGTLLLLLVCLLLLVNFTISSLLLGSEKNVAELKHHSMAKKWQLSGKMSQFLKRLYLPCLWCQMEMDALDYLMVEIWSFIFF